MVQNSTELFKHCMLLFASLKLPVYASQELVLLEREQEVLEREQTVGTLREQVLITPVSVLSQLVMVHGML